MGIKVKTSAIFTPRLVAMLRSPEGEIRKLALNELMQSLSPRVLTALAQQVSGSNAEDLAQEFLLRLCRIDWTNIDYPAGYAARVFYSLLSEYWRNAKKNAFVSLDRLNPETESSLAETIEDPYTDREDLFEKMEVHMSEGEKVLYQYRFVQGMQFKEIGRVLGISKDAATQRWCKLIKKLRKKLADEQ